LTLYLHIGLHKTGTSTLQNVLGRHAQALAALGVLWPKSGRAGGAHHNIAYELLGRPRFDPSLGGLDDLLRETSDAERAVVSSEDMEFLELGGVRALKARLGDRDVKVVVYLRRQDELIASTYAQQVKMGALLGPFEEYARASLYAPRFDFSQLLGRWTGVFGGEAIQAGVSMPDAPPEALIQDFATRVGLDPVLLAGARLRRLNVSPSANSVELIRRTTRILKRHGRKPSPEIMPAVIRAVEARVAAEPELQNGKLGLPPDLYARAAGRFGAGNRAVATRYLSDPTALSYGAPPAPTRLAPGPRLARMAEDIAGALMSDAEASHG
jgi:hypothetical protein